MTIGQIIAIIVLILAALLAVGVLPFTAVVVGLLIAGLAAAVLVGGRTF